ncbi:hypothetical protein DFH07DRAFT_769964, partial [Mycena maculata]
MNLHISWSGVHTSITSNKDEQKLADVTSILNGSTVDLPVKVKDDETLLGAMAASNVRFGSGGRRGGAGRGNRYSGGVVVFMLTVVVLAILPPIRRGIIGATPPMKTIVIAVVDLVIP